MTHAYHLEINNEPDGADGLIVFAKNEREARKIGFEYYQNRGYWFGIEINQAKLITK